MIDNQPRQERLDKILSHAGYGSRAYVKKLIRLGVVTCGGISVSDPEKKFIAEAAHIAVDGVELKYSRRAYLMMNKPEGVISATYDNIHRTVTDLLPDNYRARNLFPVGRLDIDTTGLLLLTDDGDLAHRLLSPKKHIEKEYEAVLNILPGADVVEAFGSGVILDESIQLRPAKLLLPPFAGADTDAGMISGADTDADMISGADADADMISGADADASMISGDDADIGSGADADTDIHSGADDCCAVTEPEKFYTVRVTVTEGKYHQVKRMFSVYGISVIALKRIRMGRLTLDPDLAPGDMRELTEHELSLLTNP